QGTIAASPAPPLIVAHQRQPLLGAQGTQVSRKRERTGRRRRNHDWRPRTRGTLARLPRRERSFSIRLRVLKEITFTYPESACNLFPARGVAQVVAVPSYTPSNETETRGRADNLHQSVARHDSPVSSRQTSQDTSISFASIGSDVACMTSC